MKQTYQTKPRKILLEFLTQNPDKKFCVQQIFEGTGKKFSISSIYRNLSNLEKQGVLKRFAGSGREGTLFQAVLDENCKNFLHMTCKFCGKTLHIQQKTCLSLEKNLKDNDGFCLDKEATTLIGVCKDCKN